MAATAKETTRVAVEDVRRELQAQFEQTRADSRRKQEEMERQVAEVAKGLESLTQQLNLFKPASVDQVKGGQEDISAAVEARLNLQSSRIDAVDESVQRTEKTAVENSEILHNLLVGLENLSENVKQLGEEVRGTGDSGAQEELNALFQEVDETIPAARDQIPTPTLPQTVNVSIPPMSASILFPQASRSGDGDEDLIQMKNKLNTLRSSGQMTTRTTMEDSFRFNTPANMTLPYPGLDGHQRRITPIPISIPIPPAEKAASKPIPAPPAVSVGIGQN